MDMQLSAQQLKLGAILGTIVHAVWVVQHPVLAYERSWEGLNYSIQNSAGARGTITFSRSHTVGVFFDENSSRNPLFSDDHYDPLNYFRTASKEVRDIARNEALQYVLDDKGGEITPVITSAFWSIGDQLVACEPWESVFENGAFIVQKELLDTQASFAAWKDEYELVSSQIRVINSLFERRQVHSDIYLQVNETEYDLLTADGDEGIEESRELFASINIILP